MVQKERRFFQIKKIKSSYFFIGSALGLLSLLFMMNVVGWLFSYLNWDIYPFIGVAILLLFLILLFGYIGKKISNQLCVNISNFLSGFYIFGFLLAILLGIALVISTFMGFWDFVFP